ncbi:FkbM family methyltransferase [Bradyrhizobium sp. STM 3562]|uniref:FkbM family methyltransferase n=1 Tax=Bradyrhizobium sp. STM 3562 TaxID=578924 RepID=UPI00388D12FE
MRNPLPWLRRDSQRFLIRGLKARFLDQRLEFDLIRQHVRSTDIVCDIGANKGSFVFWLSRWCKGGLVVAFEPQPWFAASLAELCRNLALDNVKVEPKAVFSRSGTADLFVPKAHLQSASLLGKAADAGNVETISVPTIRLDEYFRADQRIALLKVDVEGAELEVFKGAERILREHSPLLLFECENRHLEGKSVQDVFAHLESLGYSGRFVAGHRLLPLSAFDAAIHQRADSEWFWKEKDYYNNFIFSKAPLGQPQA